jgi:hypothetical protein
LSGAHVDAAGASRWCVDVTVGAAALVLIQSGAAKGATADLLITGGERVWYFSFACYASFVGRLEAVGRDAALDQLPPAAGFDAPLVASTLIGRLAVFLLSAAWCTQFTSQDCAEQSDQPHNSGCVFASGEDDAASAAIDEVHQ